MGVKMKILKRNEEYLGIWYLPEQSDKQLTGTLSISEEGIVKLFVPYGFSGIANYEKINIINGILSTGKQVTLVDCVCTNSNMSIPGFQTCNYIPSYTIIGNAYKDTDKIMFKSMKTKYDYFNLWLNMSPYTINTIFEETRLTAVDMHYKLPDIITTAYGLDRMEFQHEMNYEYDGYSNFDIKQKEGVKFIFNESRDYSEGLQILGEFSNFLTLCIGAKVQYNNIIAEDISNNEVEIIVHMQKWENKNKLREHDICIKYTFIRESLDKCIEEWVNKKELLQPIIGYFVEAHDREFHIPMSFLKVIQALEAFSRRMRSNQELSVEDFEKMVERIIYQIEDEEDKKLITSILSNEPRLRKRMTDLFMEVNDIFKISGTKRKSLIAHIVDTRNYYTHFDDVLEDRILNSSEIYYTTQLLKIVLRVILLKELGIDQELINYRISNDQEWLFLKRKMGWM